MAMDSPVSATLVEAAVVVVGERGRGDGNDRRTPPGLSVERRS
jgi:hypothetical protein